MTQTRVQRGVPQGGQFAHSAKGEATGVAVDPSPLERAVARIPQFPMVYFVDRDDRLRDHEIDHILSGNHLAAWESTMERFDESAYNNATDVAAEAWEDAYQVGEVDVPWDDLDEDSQAAMRDEVYDRDQTDLVVELTSNTPDQLMRTHLATDLGSRLNDASPDAWNGDRLFGDSPEAAARREARYGVVNDVLRSHGVDTTDPAVAEAVRELVSHGPHDWYDQTHLDVIFYDDIRSAAADPTPESTTTLRFTNAYVMLADVGTGTGYDVKIPATITRRFSPMPEENGLPADQRVFADNGDNSPLSWDETCGLVKSAYAASVEKKVDA